MNFENVNPVKIALWMLGVLVVVLWLTTALIDGGWVGRSTMSTLMQLLGATVIIVSHWWSKGKGSAWPLLLAGAMLHMAFTSLMNDYPVFDVMYTWLFWGASQEYWWLFLVLYSTAAAVAVYGFCKLISSGRRI